MIWLQSFEKDLQNNLITYHLWCSDKLVLELSQIYQQYAVKPKTNPWFQNDVLNKWLKERGLNVGVQTINTSNYKSYNTSINQLDEALNHLNNSDFQNWFNQNKYKKYDLVFKKDFSFDPNKSRIATEEFN